MWLNTYRIVFFSYREGRNSIDHNTSSICTFTLKTSQQVLFVPVQTLQFSRRNVKTVYHWLWFDSWETCGMSQTCIYHWRSRLTPRGTEHTQKAVECLCGSLSTAQMLPSPLIKRAPCVCFSQEVNSSGFSRRSPHWSFLAVQNNFLGWLYAIHCQSKLQPYAEMARKQPKKRHGEQTRTTRGWWQRELRPAELTAAWLPPAAIQRDW